MRDHATSIIRRFGLLACGARREASPVRQPAKIRVGLLPWFIGWLAGAAATLHAGPVGELGTGGSSSPSPWWPLAGAVAFGAALGLSLANLRTMKKRSRHVPTTVGPHGTDPSSVLQQLPMEYWTMDLEGN